VNKRRRKEKKTYLCVEKKRREDNGLRIEVEREEKERYGDLGGGEKKLQRKREEEKCDHLF
jgi:hypothetical protein